MKIYFDKANLMSFIASEATDPKRYSLCNEMLKKHFDIHLNMLIDDFAGEEILMDWLKTLMDDGGNVPQCISSLDKAFPCSSDLSDICAFEKALCTIENGFSTVFCLDNTQVGDLQEKGNYLITDYSGEQEMLYSLRFDDDDPYTLEINARKAFDIAELWKPMKELALPCSDIIVVDAYILSNRDLYENNIFSLIKSLSNRLIATNINVVIFTLLKNDSSPEPNWSDVRKSIQDLLAKDGLTASVSFVCPETTADFGEHARTIITNYRTYNPDATLNFYNSRGKYTSHGRYVYAKSLAKRSHLETTQEVLVSLQRLINDIKSGVKKGAIHTDSGTKLSNYLTF